MLILRDTIKNKKDTTCFYRKIDMETIRQAISNICICIVIVLIGVFIFAKIQNIDLINIVFMCASAFSATGLSVLEVGSLNIVAKFILMLLMFIGRVGPISFLSVFLINKKENNDVEYVKGNIMI